MTYIRGRNEEKYHTMDSTILLKLINRSKDQSNSEVVIFQENVAENFRPHTVAWRVLRNVERDDYFYFEYSPIIEVGMCQTMGSRGMPRMTEVEPGLAYEVVDDISGQALRLSERWVGDPSRVEVFNEHSTGVFDTNCYRSGSLLATKESLMPGGIAAFQFQSCLNFAVVSEMEDLDEVTEGGIIDSYHLLDVTTTLNLGFMTSADIIMTGGGSGPDAEPFQFTLENAKFHNIDI